MKSLVSQIVPTITLVLVSISTQAVFAKELVCNLNVESKETIGSVMNSSFPVRANVISTAQPGVEIAVANDFLNMKTGTFAGEGVLATELAAQQIQIQAVYRAWASRPEKNFLNASVTFGKDGNSKRFAAISKNDRAQASATFENKSELHELTLTCEVK